MPKTDSLLEEIKAVGTKVMGCRTMDVANNLSPATKQELLASIDNGKSLRGLARVLSAHGFVISGETLKKHKDRLCGCK